MTIEEYLTGVTQIYYQAYSIVEGEQLFIEGSAFRSTDLRDASGVLRRIRYQTISLPAKTEIDRIGTDHVYIHYGGVHLSIWPAQL